MLSKTFLLKLIQAVLFSINNYKQYTIEVGNEKNIKNKDIWDYCNHMPMLSLLGENHRLPLFNMDKRFTWLNETKRLINEFKIEYMINPGLNINKTFR